jgi:hypothetical protein
MKKIWLFLVIALIIIFVKLSLSQSPKITCTVETSCSYTNVFRISDLTDAHAELNTQSNYPYIVCCKIDGLSLSVSQEISGGFIGLSYPTDAHVEEGNQNNYGYHLHFNPGYGDVFCDATDSCDQYDTCLVSISGLTDAHVGDCMTNPYQKKICCSFGSLEISLNLNASKAKWGEDLRAWGKAKKNNIPLQNADIYVRVNGIEYCHLQTNSTGDYSCTFNVKKERIDVFNVSSTVVDPSSLKQKTTYKNFSVFMSFGFEDKNNKDVICREIPKSIQNPDGSIDVIIMKICVWK